MKLIKTLGACLAAAALLAGCGGGDEPFPVAAVPSRVTEVPASAGASAQAFTQYVTAQVQGTSETDEPLGTSLVSVAPTSETAEPVSL